MEEMVLEVDLGRGFWQDTESRCSESCSWRHADGKISGADERNCKNTRETPEIPEKRTLRKIQRDWKREYRSDFQGTSWPGPRTVHCTAGMLS